VVERQRPLRVVLGEVINKHQASETSEPPYSAETLHDRAGRWHFLKQKHTHTHSHTPLESTYLPCRVPNLRLDDLPVPRLDALGRKLHANRTLALQVELVTGKSRQEVGLPDA
jgi:hypothetical protein